MIMMIMSGSLVTNLVALAEGAATPNLRILGPLLWLFVDSTGDLRFSRL